MPTDNVVAESEQYATAKYTSRNERLFRNWANLEKHYDPWKALYKEISDYIAPGRGRFIDQEGTPNQKTKAAQKIINPAAPDAVHMLGAGLHGGLSSPARPWFQLTFEDPELNKYRAAKTWLDDCEQILYGMFKRSNFYSLIHNVYEEVGAFATGCLFLDSGTPANLLNFRYLTAGDYRFAVNEQGLCHSFYRKIRMQIHQMAASFGADNLSETSRRLLSSNPYEWRDVLHVIEPNNQYSEEGQEVNSQRMPFSSVYCEWKEGNQRLSESGYMEMPVVTPRWQVQGNEAYGWGPGPETLGLAKALQRMELNAMLAEDKYLDPPMGIAANFKDRMVDLSPGAKTSVKDTDDIRKAIGPLIQIDPQAINLYEGKISSVENRIKRMFYYELFLMIANEDRRMTATEVAARNEEKMIMIGPVINSQNYEMLDPIIDRAFNLAARAGKLPPPPQEIAEAEYKVEYVSILAQAQKLINAQGMGAYLQMATAVAAISPESVDKTNWDEFTAVYGDMVNLPSKIVREDDEVAEMREARAAEAQRQQQIVEAQANADTMNKLGSASVEEGTALEEISNSLGAV